MSLVAGMERIGPMAEAVAAGVVPDCIPTMLVLPVVSALAIAVVYQTRQITALNTKTQIMLDTLVREVLHGSKGVSNGS